MMSSGESRVRIVEGAHNALPLETETHAYRGQHASRPCAGPLTACIQRTTATTDRERGPVTRRDIVMRGAPTRICALTLGAALAMSAPEAVRALQQPAPAADT